METQLIELNSISSSSSNSNSSSSNNIIDRNTTNTNSIIIDINDDSTSRRIVDDNTLQDLIRSDRSLVIFLMVLGFYIDDDRNSYTVKVLARIWQASLLVLGGIGFGWRAFIFGGHNIANLYNSMTSASSSSIGVFIDFRFVLHGFIAPVVQAASLIYGIINVYKHMDRPVNSTIILPLLASCKRSAVIFFICMALLVIAIEAIMMTHWWYDNEVVSNNNYDDGELSKFGEQTYPLYMFHRFTYGLFFNMTVACYLSVMMLFLSLTMKQINYIQEEVMTIVNAKSLSGSFELDKYLDAKGRIVKLKNASYFSAQLLTFTAAINVICFLFFLWYYHYSFIKSTSSNDDYDDGYDQNYSGMIIYELGLIPFLLKGIYHY